MLNEECNNIEIGELVYIINNIPIYERDPPIYKLLEIKQTPLGKTAVLKVERGRKGMVVLKDNVFEINYEYISNTSPYKNAKYNGEKIDDKLVYDKRIIVIYKKWLQYKKQDSKSEMINPYGNSSKEIGKYVDTLVLEDYRELPVTEVNTFSSFKCLKRVKNE